MALKLVNPVIVDITDELFFTGFLGRLPDFMLLNALADKPSEIFLRPVGCISYLTICAL